MPAVHLPKLLMRHSTATAKADFYPETLNTLRLSFGLGQPFCMSFCGGGDPLGCVGGSVGCVEARWSKLGYAGVHWGMLRCVEARCRKVYFRGRLR